jgi:lysyl-tRNA synthetase class I
VNVIAVSETLDTIQKIKQCSHPSVNQIPDTQDTVHHYTDYNKHKIIAKIPRVGFGPPLLLAREHSSAGK